MSERGVNGDSLPHERRPARVGRSERDGVVDRELLAVEHARLNLLPLGRCRSRHLSFKCWTDEATPSWHYGTPTAVTTYTAAKERGTLNTESGDARADATPHTARRVVAGKGGTISACLRKCLFAVGSGGAHISAVA